MTRLRLYALALVGAASAAACSPAPVTEPTTTTEAVTTTENVASATTVPTATPHSLIAELFHIGEPRPSDIAAVAKVARLGTLSRDLHAAVSWPDTEAHRTTISSPIGFNQRRQIVVRTPTGYQPDRPWPLIVMYHTWGGDPDLIIDRLETLLGSNIENYVVAAPDDYRQTVLDAPPPVSSEHVSMWRTIRTRWHIDADRTYLAGYSLGGDTVITLSAMHPGALAGGLPMAAGVAFPSDVEGLVEAFLRNLRDVPMLHTYGAEDNLNIVGLNFRPQDITLAEQNEHLDEMISGLGLASYRHIRLEGVGHTGALPPQAEAIGLLSNVRPNPPSSFTHTFRYIHQADAYWVEGHEWHGEGWFATWPTVEPETNESDEAALTRTLFSLLGTIDADISGQTVTVDTTHLSDMTVWFHDDMVNFDEPITLVVNGTTVFADVIEPSVGVALAQALRTYDFDRLRLAGIRVNPETGDASIVGLDATFPPIVRGITY